MQLLCQVGLLIGITDEDANQFLVSLKKTIKMAFFEIVRKLYTCNIFLFDNSLSRLLFINQSLIILINCTC